MRTGSRAGNSRDSSVRLVLQRSGSDDRVEDERMDAAVPGEVVVRVQAATALRDQPLAGHLDVSVVNDQVRGV